MTPEMRERLERMAGAIYDAEVEDNGDDDRIPWDEQIQMIVDAYLKYALATLGALVGPNCQNCMLSCWRCGMSADGMAAGANVARIPGNNCPAASKNDQNA